MEGGRLVTAAIYGGSPSDPSSYPRGTGMNGLKIFGTPGWFLAMRSIERPKFEGRGGAMSYEIALEGSAAEDHTLSPPKFQ